MYKLDEYRPPDSSKFLEKNAMLAFSKNQGNDYKIFPPKTIKLCFNSCAIGHRKEIQPRPLPPPLKNLPNVH